MTHIDLIESIQLLTTARINCATSPRLWSFLNDAIRHLDRQLAEMLGITPMENVNVR